MIREHIFSGRTPTDPHFRWRGGDVSRLEGLSDAAFAFTIILPIVDTFQGIVTSTDLLNAMKHTLSLAVCFTIIIWIWGTHYKFFRRYGLEDNYTIFLNSALLFVVMIYVYPLKFLFTFVVDSLILRTVPVGEAGFLRSDTLLTMQVYSIGYIAIFGLFALMTHHGYRQRERLQLDEIELFITKGSIRLHLWTASVGVLSIAITLVPWPFDAGIVAGIAGMIYCLNGLVGWINGFRMDKGLKVLTARIASEAAPADE